MVNEITTGAQNTASGMNVLIQGVESLLSKLFAGKSPLILHGITGTQVEDGAQHPYGRFFYFKAGSTFRYLGTASNYVPHIYQNKVDSWDTGFIDTEAGNVALIPALSDLVTDFHGDNQNVLHQSLKPMTREYAGVEYHVVADVAGWPSHEKFERVRWYEVAEIVFEGHAEFTWDEEWTKYRFLRIHNLSDFSMTLHFGIHTYSIPAFGVKTIRWDLDDIVTTGDYLWPMMPGDPRLHMVNDNRMTANPVCNPLILLRWIENHKIDQFSTLHSPGFHIDGRLMAELIGYENLFGNQDFDTTLLGDLIHHRGKLIVMRKPPGGEWTPVEVEFRGYQSIVSDFAAVGINAAESGGVYTLSPAVEGWEIDLFAVGTNLLDKDGETVWAVTLPYTLENEWVVKGEDDQDEFDVFGKHVSVDSSKDYSTVSINPAVSRNDYEGAWYVNEFAEDVQRIAYKYESILTAGVDGYAVTFTATDTRRDLEDLINAKGLDLVEIKPTPHGFFLIVERDREADSGMLSISDADSWGALDWNNSNVPFTNDQASLNRVGVFWIGSTAWNPTAFGPSWKTIYPKSTLKESSGIDSEFSEDADQTALWNGLSGITAGEIKRLARLPVDAGSSAAPWRAFHGLESTITEFLENRTDADWYDENRANVIANNGSKTSWARPSLAVEDYNLIAGWINAVESVTPISVEDVYWELRHGIGERSGGIPRTDGETSLFEPQNSALFDLQFNSRDAGGLKPRNYYRTVDETDLYYAVLGPFLEANSIPIRTEGDLPESFLSIQSETANFRYWATQAMETDNSYWVVGTPPPGWDVGILGPYYEPGSNDRDYYGTLELGSISGLSDIPNEYRFNTGGNFKWLSTLDIKEFAASKGLPFYHRQIGIPVRISIYEPPDPTWEVARTPSFVGLNIDDIRPREAPGTGVDVGPHSIAGGEFSMPTKHAYLERVFADEDAEFILVLPDEGLFLTVRNVTTGSESVEPFPIWFNAGTLMTPENNHVVLGWVRPVYSEGFLDWVYGRKQAIAIETTATNDVEVTVKSRLFPTPFPWTEQGADTFAVSHPTPDANSSGASFSRYYPINYARMGTTIPNTTNHESDFSIINTDEFGVYRPLIYWRATAT